MKFLILAILVLLLSTRCQYKLLGIDQELHFEQDSSNFNDDNLNTLSGIINFCNLDSNMHLKVIGFSDTIGTNEYNMELSKLRSLKVYNYIMENSKLQKENTSVQWFGESKISNDYKDEKLREQQNLVYVSFKSPKGISFLKMLK
ncbi:MAG TPA: OmpA family protein [Chitinophagales bacterium]|nr:OmpA family protein [Chitinophagales bacterium]